MQTLDRDEAAKIIRAAQILTRKGDDGLDEVAALVGHATAIAMFVAVRQDRIVKRVLDRGETSEFSKPFDQLLESLSPELWQSLYKRKLVKLAAA